MAWSIAEVARMSKTTSRTLRHYHDIGLLEPAYTGDNGYRYYRREQLLRLQQILLLRDLGLRLPWTADRASYPGLGDMYASDDRFRDQIEEIEPGLARYLRDAMAAFADR